MTDKETCEYMGAALTNEDIGAMDEGEGVVE